MKPTDEIDARHGYFSQAIRENKLLVMLGDGDKVCGEGLLGGKREARQNVARAPALSARKYLYIYFYIDRYLDGPSFSPPITPLGRGIPGPILETPGLRHSGLGKRSFPSLKKTGYLDARLQDAFTTHEPIHHTSSSSEELSSSFSRTPLLLCALVAGPIPLRLRLGFRVS
jgi:hypothetical protein